MRTRVRAEKPTLSVKVELPASFRQYSAREDVVPEHACMLTAEKGLKA